MKRRKKQKQIQIIRLFSSVYGRSMMVAKQVTNHRHPQRNKPTTKLTNYGSHLYQAQAQASAHTYVRVFQS